MANFPETRLSLLLRLPTSATRDIDQAAWVEFASIYSPFVYRFALKQGLQDADAQDVTQQVLTSVAKAIDRWRPKATQGNASAKFRSWLFTIARNHLINRLQQQARRPATGGSSHAMRLAAIPESRDGLEEDFRREAFYVAAAKVREQVAELTWHAFWKTTVDGITCEEAALQLGVSIGSIYAARSRVMAKLRETVQLMTAENRMAVEPSTMQEFE